MPPYPKGFGKKNQNPVKVLITGVERPAAKRPLTDPRQASAPSDRTAAMSPTLFRCGCGVVRPRNSRCEKHCSVLTSPRSGWGSKGTTNLRSGKMIPV